MSKSEDTVVEEWIATIAAACDENSPFAGMVDLSPVHRLPLPVQKRIFMGLTPKQNAAMRRLYWSMPE